MLKLLMLAAAGSVALHGCLDKEAAAARARLQSSIAPTSSAALRLRTFDRVCELVGANYYRTDQALERFTVECATERARAARSKDAFELYFSILNPMLSRLSPSHSMALPPVRTATPEAPAAAAGSPSAVRTAPGLSLEDGVGLTWAAPAGGPTVVTGVSRGSEADARGVEPGWVVEKFLVRATASDAGHAEFTFRLGDGSRRQVAYDFKAAPPHPSFQRIDLASGVRLYAFDEIDAVVTGQVIDDLTRNPPRAVILDLRRCAGGSTRYGDRLLSIFLSRNSLLSTTLTRGGATESRSTGAYGHFPGSIAVLVGPATASYAEELAYNLRLYRGARLYGARSAGKVVNARTFPLPDGGSLEIPTGEIRMSDGKVINGEGVTPDEEVWGRLAAVRQGRDLVLEAALLRLGTG